MEILPRESAPSPANKPQAINGGHRRKSSITFADQATVIGSPKKETITKLDSVDNTEVHYEVDEACEFMREHSLRNGQARYAVKRMHRNLTKIKRVRGQIDLAIETKFLKSLQHPNIVKMRAYATADILAENFFIVLDRLYGTLEDRWNEWKQERKRAKGLLGKIGIGTDKAALDRNLTERLLCCYDLTSALKYMHQNKIVYRDIKPENIGFDIRSDAKIFDFGLAKPLSPKLKTKTGMFKLTAYTGELLELLVRVVM